MGPNSEKNNKITRWVITVVSVCILIYLGVKNIGALYGAVSWFFRLISPLTVGFALALIFNVPMAYFERHLFARSKNAAIRKGRRALSILLSIVLVVGIFTGVIWLVVPELIQAITVIVNSAVELLNRLEDLDLSQVADNPVAGLLGTINFHELGAALQNWLTGAAGSIVNGAMGTITSLFNGLVNLFISLIFAIYILSNKEKLKLQCCRLIRAWLPEHFGSWFIHACRLASGNFRNFVSGQTLEALILGSLCMIGMLIFRIPYAPMVGALVGVTAFVPVVGAFAGAIIGAFMILTVSPVKAVIFVVFLIILQQIEGNLIYPKVMGSRVNLPAMWVLAGVSVGGGLAGPVGMLLSVPVTSTVYVLVKEATVERERRLAEERSARQESAPQGDGEQ